MRTIQGMYENATSMKFVLHLVRAFANNKAKQVTVTEPTKCSVSNEVLQPGKVMVVGHKSNCVLSPTSYTELQKFIELNATDRRISWLLNELSLQETTSVE